MIVACVHGWIAGLAAGLVVFSAIVSNALVTRRLQRRRPDAGRPAQPTSPMWTKETARPHPNTRVTGSPRERSDLVPLDYDRYSR